MSRGCPLQTNSFECMFPALLLFVPVSTAMSCRLDLRFSPKPGALTATTFTPARSLFTIRVARACADTQACRRCQHQLNRKPTTASHVGLLCCSKTSTLSRIGQPPVTRAVVITTTDSSPSYKVTKHPEPLRQLLLSPAGSGTPTAYRPPQVFTRLCLHVHPNPPHSPRPLQ
jgi:hypothetical protein